MRKSFRKTRISHLWLISWFLTSELYDILKVYGGIGALDARCPMDSRRGEMFLLAFEPCVHGDLRIGYSQPTEIL